MTSFTVLKLASAIAVIGVMLVGATASQAAPSHARAAAAAAKQTPTFEPAKFIQIRPGYWVSSYGCVTDNGYGRMTSCSLGGEGGGGAGGGD